MSEVQTNPETVAEPVVSPLSLNDFYSKLSERVSDYNAKLLLHSVAVGAGVSHTKEENLNMEEAKNLCLELIKKGGPAFQVGKDLYNHIQ